MTDDEKYELISKITEFSYYVMLAIVIITILIVTILGIYREVCILYTAG